MQNQSQQQGQQPQQAQQQQQNVQNFSNQPQGQQGSYQQGQQPYTQQVQNNPQPPKVVQMQGSKQLQNPQSGQQGNLNQTQQNVPSGQSQSNFNDISSQKQQQPYNSQSNLQNQPYSQPQTQTNQVQPPSQIPQTQNNSQYQSYGQNINQSQTQPLNYQNQTQSNSQNQQQLSYQNPPQSQTQPQQQLNYQSQPQSHIQPQQQLQNNSQLPQASSQQYQFQQSQNPQQPLPQQPLQNQPQSQLVQPQQPPQSLKNQPLPQQPLTQQQQQQQQQPQQSQPLQNQPQPQQPLPQQNPQQPQSQEQLVSQPPSSQLPKPEEVIDETNLTGPQIVNYIKKKPYTQKVGSRQYTYSVLSKKQKTFIMSNDRFLILKGIEEISYAREFDPKKNTVPFADEEQIPKAKSTYPIMEIEKIESTQEKLTVFFSGAKKQKWQFVCPSKDCALKWKSKINDAMAAYKQFKESGLDNYEVFQKMKQGQQQNIQNPNQNPNLLPNQQQGQFGIQQGQGNFQNGQTNQSGIRQQTNNSKLWNSSLDRQKQFSSNVNTSQFNNQNRSNDIFRGPQAERIQNFITDKQQQPRQYLSQSMSRIPMEQREKIKHDIRKLRRNWIEELIGGEEEVELLISFNSYVQRISQVIINQLYIHNSVKIFPSHETGKDFISYLLDDIYIEIYLVSQEQQNTKNPRYKNAVLEFKNYDYLLSATKNQGPLKVPLMTIFEFKGFLGMAKSKIGQSKGFKNRQFYDNVDRRQFEELTKISAQVLLNQAKCKIISYDRPQVLYNFANKPQKLYFLETFLEFLPNENTKQFGLNKDNILRAQLVKDQNLEDQLFRDRSRQVRNDKINDLIDKQIDELVKILEFQYDYFANSQELTELIHLYGLNVRYIGMIFKKTKLKWLKKLLQAEISARCLKNYFRKEIQSSFFYNGDQGVNKQRQEERERAKVINFLNIVFGNNQPTFRLWRSLNNTAQEKYHVRIWDDKYSDVNSGYLLQAIQTHFKIVLNPQVANRRVFATSNSFQLRDFVKFNFDCSIYNLDFTAIFTEINELLEDETPEAFQDLCDLLTRENASNLPYLQILQKHPIHNNISKFMLTFASPEDTPDLYRKIENANIPHKLLFDSKFAEIKWYLKTNKQERVNNSIGYTIDNIRRWYGQLHPLYSQFNRMLAQFYSEQQFFDAKALKFANSSLSMQQALFEGDHEEIWKDYYLIGKIHFLNSRQEESLSYLVKAKNLVRVESLNNHFEAYGELCLMLSKVYFTARYFKQSYTTVRELYKLIREERDEKSLHFIVEAVGLIKQLLEINQQHESYYRFVQADFSSIIYAFADYPKLMLNSIKMITIPYLKNVILRNSKNKAKLLAIIEEVSKIKQSTQSCQAYIKAKIRQGVFPKSYLHYLKDIDAVVDEIIANQMILRWKSYNTYANESILDKIGASQINRGFEFLANMTALFNFLGQEVLEELFIMEK